MQYKGGFSKEISLDERSVRKYRALYLIYQEFPKIAFLSVSIDEFLKFQSEFLLQMKTQSELQFWRYLNRDVTSECVLDDYIEHEKHIFMSQELEEMEKKIITILQMV